MKVPITPGVPSLIISTPNKDGRLIYDDSQTRYRSSVGSILYLVKISRPYLSNISRELSKVMMKCTSFHYSLLLRALKYIEKTILYGIYYNPKDKMNLSNNNNKLWELSIFSDPYWDCDTQTRKSVSVWEMF